MFGKKSGVYGAGGGLYADYKNRKATEKNTTPQIDLKNNREEIFVYSLKHGTGTTYIAAAIANFIAEHGKRVTLVMADTEYADELVLSKVSTTTWDEEDYYGQTEYVVYDGGIYEEMGSEQNAMFKHSSKKFLVCQGDGWYLSRMAEYGCDEEHPELEFLFNRIPSEWEPKVKDVMDFTDAVYFIKNFNVMNVGELDLIFGKIVR